MATKGQVMVEIHTDIVDQEQVYEKEGSWSDLPECLLSDIFSSLYAGDKVMFRSVCRSWNSVCPSVTIQKFQFNEFLGCSYPYLMFSKHRIFHPIYGECHRTGSKHLPPAAGSIYKNLHHYSDVVDMEGASVRVAKDGWLLMTMGANNIFFFNPLTKEKVQLPDLVDVPESMYFSSPPTSKDWLVIATLPTAATRIVLMTLKSGEDSWSECEFRVHHEPFEFSYCNAVVFKGLYYFLGIGAKLLIHDPVKKTFYVHEYAAPQSVYINSSSMQQYMLVSDGKLLAVFEGCDGSSVRVCRWNHSKKMWETLKSLGDRVLFVSRPQSLCVKATIRGTGNKVFFPRLIGSNCLFYSLTTNKFHTFAMDNSYGSFLESKEYLHATWMP